MTAAAAAAFQATAAPPLPSRRVSLAKMIQGICYGLLPLGIVLIVIFFVVSDVSARNTALIVVGGLAGFVLLCFVGSTVKMMCGTGGLQEDAVPTTGDVAPRQLGVTHSHNNRGFFLSESVTSPQIYVTQNTNFHFSNTSSSDPQTTMYSQTERSMR